MKKVMKENEQLFAGSQVNMCEAARLGCTLYDDEQKVFGANNLIYTKDWSNTLRQKIIDALALPDEDTRRSIPAGKRVQMKSLAHTGIDLWLILSGNIKNIATKDEVASLLVEAGHNKYKAATGNKWPEVKALLKAGSDFITNNEDWLLNNGKGMAPDFPERYNAAATAFINASGGFYDAKGDMPGETLTKVEAMNSVYTMLIGMLDDGKKYFHRNKAVRKQFTYQSLLSKVQGTSTISGVNIKAQAEGTLQPITTAFATFMPTGYSFEANKKGIIPGRVPAGKYTVTITAPGCQTVETAVTVKSGVVGRKTFVFIKAANMGKQETV